MLSASERFIALAEIVKPAGSAKPLALYKAASAAVADAPVRSIGVPATNVKLLLSEKM